MKIKNMVSLLALSAAVLSSCSLDKFPLDKETSESYFKDEAQLQNVSNTFYADLFTGPFFNDENDLCFKNTLPVIMKGGKLRVVPSAGGGWEWGTLRDINNMLDNIGRCSDDAARTEYTAVARFFRAYFYYLKVRDFGDVPWYEHEIEATDKDALYKGRDSRDYVMGKMIEDIDYAIANLSAEKKAYRVTRWTALAFKSRFCLFEGTWRKYHGNDGMEHDADWYLGQAASAAKEFITTSPYKIYNTGHPESDYMMLFASQNANTDEVILAKNYSYSLGISHFATYNTFGLNQHAFNKKFVDSFLMKDGSRFTDKDGWATMEYYDEVKDRDPRLAQVMRCPGYRRISELSDEERAKNPDSERDSLMVSDFGNACTGYQVVKYAQSYETLPTGRWMATDNDMPIFRAAEVYLNYAEAMAERGDVTISQADIDMSIKPLRDRAGMPNLDLAKANASPCKYMSSAEYGYSNVSGANKGVILEIRRERAIELIQEGDFRWYDLMRWKEGKCIEQNLYGMYFPAADRGYDLDGDGDDEVYIYTSAKPAGLDETVTYNVLQLNKTINLSAGGSGYVDPHKKTSHVFDESRDYLKPLPSEDLAMNKNLKQNPNWDIKKK